MFGAFSTEMDLPKTEVKFTYLILSQPRTGSTMITSALLSSGLAGVPVEYFHTDYLKHLFQPLSLNAVQKYYLITHELQPTLAGDMALEGFVPRPTRGAGSWRRDRISG